jgi:hypothetical protein
MRSRILSEMVLLSLPLLWIVEAPSGAPSRARESVLYVDPSKGKDSSPGTKGRPLRTISAALATLHEPLQDDVTIHVLRGEQRSTGGVGMSDRSLQLMHRMRPGVSVRFVGAGDSEPSVMAWEGDRMIDVYEGTWRFERLQVGTFSTKQRRGIQVRGPAHVILEDVDFRLRSHSDVAILATGGGRVSLRGAIRLNAQLANLDPDPVEAAEDETFCGIMATDHGIVEYDRREGSSLEIGNGSLSVRNYGRIALGCESAAITCWTKSNNLTISNSGRIDLRNTPTVLRAQLKNNTPIGLEHDGHILAEDAHLKIIGPNDSAIALQKASTLTCNDIELDGEFEYALWASSGSMFVGRFLTDVSKLDAKTGAQILVEGIAGRLGEAVAQSGGLISLPNRLVRSE